MTNVGFGATATTGFAAALVYGADNGAHISSNSWGYTRQNAYNQAVLDAIDYADEMGIVVVFAAGNDNSYANWYPGYYSKTVAVAATDNIGTAASFTNYGSWVDIAAPGTAVLSTTETGYGTWAGTSMACPHVAGVLALGKAVDPNTDAAMMKSCLFSTADNIDSVNIVPKQGNLGAGMVNATAFLDCLSSGPPLSPTPAPTPAPTAVPTPADPVGPPTCSSYTNKETCNNAAMCFWGTKPECEPTKQGNPKNNQCCTSP